VIDTKRMIIGMMQLLDEELDPYTNTEQYGPRESAYRTACEKADAFDSIAYSAGLSSYPDQVAQTAEKLRSIAVQRRHFELELIQHRAFVRDLRKLLMEESPRNLRKSIEAIRQEHGL